MVVAATPAAVMTSLAGAMQAAGFQAMAGADAGNATFVDGRGQHAPVTATCRRDRFGTVVSTEGLPAQLGATLLRELEGVIAPPPIGRPVSVAAVDPEARLEEQTRPRHAKRVAPGYALRFDDGRSLPLEARMLLGRDPAAPSGSPSVALVPIDDPDRALSKTHAAIEVQADRVLVQDLGSTNGTFVVGTDGELQELRPGQPAVLPLGGVVVLGRLRATLVERS
jgi:hypothetical protein